MSFKNFTPPQVRERRGLHERFQRNTRVLGWERRGERVLLGLSGGRDSVTLLHLLLVNGHRVTAAHLNHRLRGRESEADARFVRALCRSWNVPLVGETAAVRPLARRHRLSLEEAARVTRYRFLERAARASRIRKVVVAHHELDQAETVLLRVLQSGRRDMMAGMAWRRPFPRFDGDGSRRAGSRSKLELVRPLLDAPRDEMARYAHAHRLAWREDRSNRDLDRPRNWVRHRLIPRIERRLNRNVVGTLARLGGKLLGTTCSGQEKGERRKSKGKS